VRSTTTRSNLKQPYSSHPRRHTRLSFSPESLSNISTQVLYARIPTAAGKMPNACAPLSLVLQAIQLGREIRRNSKAKKSFFDALPSLLQRQVVLGNLEVLSVAPG